MTSHFHINSLALLPPSARKRTQSSEMLTLAIGVVVVVAAVIVVVVLAASGTDGGTIRIDAKHRSLVPLPWRTVVARLLTACCVRRKKADSFQCAIEVANLAVGARGTAASLYALLQDKSDTTDSAAAGTPPVPVLLHVATFPSIVRLITHSSFPFNPLGAVHVSSTLTLASGVAWRPDFDKLLLHSVTRVLGFRPHARVRSWGMRAAGLAAQLANVNTRLTHTSHNTQATVHAQARPHIYTHTHIHTHTQHDTSHTVCRLLVALCGTPLGRSSSHGVKAGAQL